MYKRRNPFTPGINNLFTLTKGQIVQISGHKDSWIYFVQLHCLVQKQATDNMDERVWAPMKLHLRTPKFEFYKIFTYHGILFFF